MSALDIFALVILVILGSTIVGCILLVGYLPGRIARERSHPQAEAVSVCGWMGILTGGLLLPVAFVWAYLKSPSTSTREGSQS